MTAITIPPRGTRGRRITVFFFKLLRPLVLLTTVGAKTRRERTSVFGGFEGQNANREIPIVRLKAA